MSTYTCQRCGQESRCGHNDWADRHPVAAVAQRSEDGSRKDEPVRTFSLAEVAELVLPPEWTDGERWLARRLNRNEIRGYRVGRIWRMSEIHVREFIESCSNTVRIKAAPADPREPARSMSVLSGLSPRGRTRVIRQGQQSI